MATIRNKATLDSTQFQAGLGKMQGGVQSLSKSFASISGIGAGLSFAGLAAGARAALRTADEIDNLAKQSDLGVEALQALKFQAEEAGIQFETMRPAINALRRAVEAAKGGNEQYAKSFETLGVSSQELSGMSTEQVLNAVAKAMYESADSADVSVAATKVLGAESTRLNGILKDLGSEGLQQLIERLKESGHIMSEQTVGSLDRAEESASRLGNRLKNMAMISVAGANDANDALWAYVGALSAGASNSEAMAAASKAVYGELDEVTESAKEATDEVEALSKAQIKAAQELSDINFDEMFGDMSLDQQLADLEKMAEVAGNRAAQAWSEGDAEKQLEFTKQRLEYEKEAAKVRAEIEKRDADKAGIKEAVKAAEEKLRLSRLTDEQLKHELKLKLAIAQTALMHVENDARRLEILREIYDLEQGINRLKEPDADMPADELDQSLQGDLRRIGGLGSGASALSNESASVNSRHVQEAQRVRERQLKISEEQLAALREFAEARAIL